MWNPFQEVAATHEISNVCCVVRDNNNPAIFGYATTTTENTAQNLAHVFTTDSPVRIRISHNFESEPYKTKMNLLDNNTKMGNFAFDYRKKQQKFYLLYARGLLQVKVKPVNLLMKML